MTAPQTLPTTAQIKTVLASSSRGPLKAKDLARTLKVSNQDYRRFRNLLRRLERVGELYRIKGNRYAVPEKINLTVGPLRVTKRGDAFVRPEQDGGTEVFVPMRNQESALDGDRVAVRIEGRPPGRAPVGRVVKVLERSRPTIVGTYHTTKGFGFVRPLDRKVSRDVVVPTPNAGDAQDMDVVVVRVTQFGDRRLSAMGEVERVLGPMDDSGVDVLAILHSHGLPAEFPREVEAAAREAEIRVREPGTRVDRTELHVFTIDPSDAKDHDDALSVESVGEDLWEVGVHIADVSHFVDEGSVLDLEAYRRGTSVYLVDQVVPMLPHRLSSDLCSLQEGEDRFAVSLLVTIDAEARVRSHRFERTLIRTRVGLDYERVQSVLEGRESVDEATDTALRQLDLIAKQLRERRRSRGSLDFDLPEARVVLDDEGFPIDIQRRVQLDSHRLIEDFMILANEVVARDALEKKLPIPFRIHDPPTDDRMDDLKEFLASIGHTMPRGRVTPKALQGVLDRTAGKPEAGLASTVILRSMSRARYEPANSGHFGLASKAYCHFTSPIRRYPDLVVHRVIVRTLIDGRPPHDRWDLERLTETCARSSDRERVAQDAERDSVDMKKIEFMRRHLGDEFSGTVSGVAAFGFFVLLDDYYVEGLVHVSGLGDDYYTFLPGSYALVGDRSGRRFRLGDRVRVRVDRVNKEEREIDFALLDRSESD